MTVARIQLNDAAGISILEYALEQVCVRNEQDLHVILSVLFGVVVLFHLLAIADKSMETIVHHGLSKF